MVKGKKTNWINYDRYRPPTVAEQHMRIREQIEKFEEFAGRGLPNEDALSYGSVLTTDDLLDLTPLFKKEDKEMAKRTKHKLDSIMVKRNVLGDTRSADRIPTFDEFRDANRQHVSEVKCALERIAYLISRVGSDHDITKYRYDGEFYRDFCIKMTHPEEDFTEMPWYQGHIAAERHHINTNCPDDVDLIDILEHIADCVCAGKARNEDGEVYPIKINADILLKAVENTQKLIEDSIKVSDIYKKDDEPENIQFT